MMVLICIFLVVSGIFSNVFIGPLYIFENCIYLDNFALPGT